MWKNLHRHIRRDLRLRASNLIRGRRSGPLSCVLSLLSNIFRLAVACRRLLYGLGIFRAHRLACPVICVGNLTVGGTGKTTVVECLARELTKRGHRVAILSRGYGSKPEKGRLFTKNQPRIVSDGQRILLNAEAAGDEALMLAKNLQGVVVISGKNRLKSAAVAMKSYGCNMLILDDGFQYLRLRSQVSILLVDKSNPFGNGHFLPRGILREPISAMRRATHILLTRADGPPNESLNLLLKKHSKYPPMESCLIAKELRSSTQKAPISLQTLAGKRVAIFSGIANPESFENFIHAAGPHVVYNRRFPDHYSFDTEEITHICEEANNLHAEMIITTEKDLARLPDEIVHTRPIFYLRVYIKITKGQKIWENLLSSPPPQSGKFTKHLSQRMLGSRAQRHDNAKEVTVVADHPGAQMVPEFEDNFVIPQRAKGFRQIPGVEADFHRLPSLVDDGQPFPGVAVLRTGRGNFQKIFAEGQFNRFADVVRNQRRPLDSGKEKFPVDAHAGIGAAGNHLLVIRVISLDDLGNNVRGRWPRWRFVCGMERDLAGVEGKADLGSIGQKFFQFPNGQAGDDEKAFGSGNFPPYGCQSPSIRGHQRHTALGKIKIYAPENLPMVIGGLGIGHLGNHLA
jgi:tetraacyldisaccharide 4'-kinase